MSAPLSASLRRDLGTIESYATLLGMLIGAGIFKVTSDAWELTGPSVILGYLVLAPAILATSVAYSVFLSTPLGREPGGEYTHLSRTFGGYGLAFVGVWLKVISYIGALAYLARALADYLIELFGGALPKSAAMPIADRQSSFSSTSSTSPACAGSDGSRSGCACFLGVSIVVLVVAGTLRHPPRQLQAVLHAWRGRIRGRAAADLLRLRRIRVAGADGGGGARLDASPAAHFSARHPGDDGHLLPDVGRRLRRAAGRGAAARPRRRWPRRRRAICRSARRGSSPSARSWR